MAQLYTSVYKTTNNKWKQLISIFVITTCRSLCWSEKNTEIMFRLLYIFFIRFRIVGLLPTYLLIWFNRAVASGVPAAPGPFSPGTSANQSNRIFISTNSLFSTLSSFYTDWKIITRFYWIFMNYSGYNINNFVSRKTRRGWSTSDGCLDELPNYQGVFVNATVMAILRKVRKLFTNWDKLVSITITVDGSMKEKGLWWSRSIWKFVLTDIILNNLRILFSGLFNWI